MARLLAVGILATWLALLAGGPDGTFAFPGIGLARHLKGCAPALGPLPPHHSTRLQRPSRLTAVAAAGKGFDAGGKKAKKQGKPEVPQEAAPEEKAKATSAKEKPKAEASAPAPAPEQPAKATSAKEKPKAEASAPAPAPEQPAKATSAKEKPKAEASAPAPVPEPSPAPPPPPAPAPPPPPKMEKPKEEASTPAPVSESTPAPAPAPPSTPKMEKPKAEESTLAPDSAPTPAPAPPPTPKVETPKAEASAPAKEPKASEQAASFKKDLGSASSTSSTSKDADDDAGLPSWAPVAAASVVALLLFFFAISKLFEPPPKPEPVRAPPAPVVVKVDAPSPAKPAPAPATSRPSSAAPAPVVPAKPAPPVPQPSRTSETEFDLARKLSAGAANGLRAAADLLPKAEQAIEQSAPAIEGGLQKIASGDPNQALPVVGNAVASASETVARTGLQAISGGLGIAADSLPAAGQAVNSAVEAALPSIQSGARASAEAVRSLADKIPPPASSENLGETILPSVLKGAASGLEVLADAAPTAEKAISYAASKALPIVQSGLRATSQVSADAAGAKLPDGSQVASTLKSVGVDPSDLASKAGDLAREAAAKASERVAGLKGVPPSPPASVMPSKVAEVVKQAAP